MRCLVVDDHGLVAEGLKLLLEARVPNWQVALAADAPAALAQVEKGGFGLVLLDWNLNGTDSTVLLKRMLDLQSVAPVVVVSADDSEHTVRAAIDGGASGFIPKSSTADVLLMALQLINAGGVYLPSFGAHRQRGTPPQTTSVSQAFPGLTERQTQVLQALVQGKSNKQIARQLDISDTTVKVHLSAIFRTLHVASRTEAMYTLAKGGVMLQ